MRKIAILVVAFLLVAAITATGCNTKQIPEENNEITATTTLSVTETPRATTTVKPTVIMPTKSPTSLPTVNPTATPIIPTPTITPTVVPKVQPTILWHAMGGASIFFNPNPTINKTQYPQYTMSCNVQPYSACLTLRWYLDGQELYGQNSCPQTTIASVVLFSTTDLQPGYHTIQVRFDGDAHYYAASLSGTFLVIN